MKTVLKTVSNYLLFYSVSAGCIGAAYGQSPIDSIVTSIRVINDSTVSKTNMLVSYRGLNKFLGQRISTYLTDGGDLSLFSNYALFNSSDGRLSLHHNISFKNEEERVRALLDIGVRANVSEAFASIFENGNLSEDLGLSVKFTMIGKGSAFFDKQVQQTEGLLFTPGPQKRRMDAERATIISELRLRLMREVADFETKLENVDPGDMSPGEDWQSRSDTLRRKFYKQLHTKYLKLFSEREADALADPGAFNLLTTWWVSVSGYIPITSSELNVAADFGSSFKRHQVYPWELNLSVNKILESRRKWFGRIFLSGEMGAYQNSTVKAEVTEKVNLNSYKNLGGTDTLSYALLSSSDAYVGKFERFITPVFRAQFVWFPHALKIVGLSLLGEQSVGKQQSLNAKFGIPFKLKGKDPDSVVSFELQARGTDLSKTIDSEKKMSDRITYGISVGLPFSSLIY